MRRLLAMLVLSFPAAAAFSAAAAEPASRPDNIGQETRAAMDQADAARERLEQVEAAMTATNDILDTGLTGGDAGEMLRELRRRAPDPDAVSRRLSGIEQQVAEARLHRVGLYERRRGSKTFAEIAAVNAELGEQESYIFELERVIAVQGKLVAESGDLVRKLDSELLWIGSAPPVGAAWPADVTRGALWIANPAAWVGAGKTLVRRLGEVPVASFAVTVLAGGLVFTRRRLKRRLDALSAGVGKYASDSFLLTARALAVTLVLALPVPLAGAGLGGLLATQNADGFARAVGHGLLAAAAVWLLLDFFRLMCRNNGLADAHFHWNARARRTLLNNLRALLLAEVPAALVVSTCENGGNELYRQGLGRAAFLFGSVALTVFVARVFRPGSGVFSELMTRDGWAWRLRRAWYAALVGLPAALTLLAALGYYYTATEIEGRFFITGAVVLAGVVVYSLFARALLIARRRLAMQQARQKLAEAREARLKPEGEADVSGDAVPELEPATVDIAAASEQTLSLLRTLAAVGVLAALWAVWSDLTPALSVLKDVRLTAGTFDTESNVIVAPVTLWSLLMTALAVTLTVVAARNLPAVLELAVLQRFPLDGGTRYALSSLTRYAVVATGLVVASKLLGVEWGRAQWIIAALGVGLGFGLQEIVANFVSGLIILFERPVRVGDTVTVGDVTGTVSRLQIRATTLTDFDNKEVLVPNKSFITDRVVNWTLSNSVTRLMIPVGVAYGSDVAETQRLIADVVRRTPAVLADPAASVFFMGFGDSSLNFEVRCFVGELGKRLPTIHELHTGIDAALKTAGIEIPFPQRDLHLRSSDIGDLSRPSVDRAA